MWKIIDQFSDSFGRRQEPVESLERYFSVMNDELPARFRICKKTPVKIDLDSSNKEGLWMEHDSALDEFEELLKKVDNGKIDLSELEKPDNSLLDLKVYLSKRIMESCEFCEYKCGVNRLQGETGFCGVGERPRIASDFVHTGEEPELVPSYTIFFSGCTFECQFCQNWDISQNPERGRISSPEEISSLIAEKRDEGVRNVNWVGGDPTPNLHSVLESLVLCEFNIPSIWNSNMYLSEKGMNLLFGTQDVYLTDFKYGNNECGLKYSKIPDYWDIVSRNHRLAFEDAELIIRHLILPGHVECCTRRIIKWIKDELNHKVRVNLMDQYRPVAKASSYPEISRMISNEEMKKVLKIAEEQGLKNIIW